MKLLFIFLILMVYSCANPSADSICNGNPCKERPNRTVCKTNGTTFQCLCDSGYKEINGICIKDSGTIPCEPNPCKTEHRTICNGDNGISICLCDEGYHDENSVCVENTLNCNTNQHEEVLECVNNNKMVDCNIITPPLNATLNTEQVEILWSNGMWNNPADCSWNCNIGFHPNPEKTACEANTLNCDENQHEEALECIDNTKMVDCNIITPPLNSTLNTEQVEIIWSNGNWSEPANCSWSCNENFHPNAENTVCEENILECEGNQHEENNSCVNNIKQVNCTNNTPETGINVDLLVDITWSNGQWSTPIDCEWYCNPEYEKTDTGCVIIGNPGAKCTGNDDCLGENTFCADYTNNGYCSSSCERDGDICMTNGVCSSQVCYKRCTLGDDSSCERDELICVNGENNIGAVCRLKCYQDNECTSGYCTNAGHCEINYTSCVYDEVSNSGCSGNNTCFDDNGNTYCYPNHGKVPGDECNGARECIAQYECLGNIEDGYTCHELCRVSDPNSYLNTTDCQSGPQICSDNLTGSDYGYCLFEYQTCNPDPVNNSGCASDEVCLNDGGTYCLFTNGSLNGETCVYSNDCIAGYGCLGNPTNGYTCMEYCRTISDCTNGGTCTHFQDEDYGYCN